MADRSTDWPGATVASVWESFRLYPSDEASETVILGYTSVNVDQSEVDISFSLRFMSPLEENVAEFAKPSDESRAQSPVVFHQYNARPLPARSVT